MGSERAESCHLAVKLSERASFNKFNKNFKMRDSDLARESGQDGDTDIAEQSIIHD